MEQNTKTIEFRFVYEDDQDGSLIYDVSSDKSERIDLTVQGGRSFLFGNKQAMLLLGKICIQMAAGNYPNGYHLHVRRNFGEQEEEILCLGVAPENTNDRQG